MVKIVCYLAVSVHQPAALSSTSNQGFTFVQFKGALPTDAGIPRVSHPINKHLSYLSLSEKDICK
jgi:hypothetical protein